LISHRLVKPHGTNITGIFGVLPNVAWTNQGAIDLAELPERQLHARLAGDVAAHEQDRADLGDRGAEAGDDGGDDAEPRLAQVHPERAGPAGAERARLLPHVRRHGLHRRERDPRDVGRRQQRLREDHRGRREEQLQPAERAAARER
jgi:hypothetical protein